MTKLRIGRATLRRKLESAGVLTVAVVAAGTLASRGPLMSHEDKAPVAQVLAAPVHVSGAVARALDGEAKTVEKGIEWDLPNLDHSSVDKWITRFTGNMKSSITTYIVRMDKYDEMIEEKAAEKGVPKDLVYLAMIESGGVASAKSPVGARGLWQFMTPTAKEYGLTSSERLDPEKSTDAALEYLGDLYDRFGSWYLAAAAYNTGQGRVARVMKQETGRTKGTDADFYRIAHRLPRETRDYVPKLIAAARIAKEPAKYGIEVGG